MSYRSHFTLSLKWLFLCLCLTAGSQAWGDDFVLYSGAITEGDYIIVYDGKAMNNTVSSNRLSYETVTPANNVISTTNTAIIWHIAASGDYWTIYNSSVSKYAGGTSTKNQGALLVSVTDYAKWTVTGTSTYEFENKGRAGGSSDTGNKWLRNNGTYGFACYASGTGGPLSLYKKSTTAASTPTFSPAAGAVPYGQEITISSSTEGATIHYTTDGNTPTTSSPTYNPSSKPAITEATTTIKAIAVKDGLTNSNVGTASYTVAPPSDPVFSLNAGMVSKGASLTLTSSGSATIRYTTDGTEPTTSIGTVYSAPIVINSAQTIKAVAYDGGGNTSSVVTKAYEIFNGDVVTFNASEHSGANSSNPLIINDVSFTCSTGVFGNGTDFRLYKNSNNTFSVTSGLIKKIEFTGVEGYAISNMTAAVGTLTTDGNDGVWTGSAASITFTASSAQTRATRIVVYVERPAAPTFSVAEGEYSSAQNVVMSCATDGAVIYYTTDGTKPNSTSSVYSSAVPITETTTLKAIAIADEIESAVTTAVYTINRPVAPAFDVPEGAFDAAFDLHLTTETDGATIYYTTDGSNPTNASTAYSTKIAIPAATTTIKAIAVKNGLTSDVASATYTYDARETPTFALSSTAVNAKVDIASNVTVTTNYDGTITATSSDPTHMPVSYNAGTKTCTFTADQAGTYTITFSATGCVNYKDAGGTVTVTVTTPQAMEVAVTTNYTWLGVSNTGSLSSFPKDINCSGITATISGEGTKTRGDTDYIRLYAKNTLKLTAPTGYHVIKVVFSHKSGSNTVTASEGTWTSSTHTWTGSAEDVTFTIGGTSGNNQINGFTVTLGELANVTSVGVGTWASDSPLDFTDATIKAYYATVEGSTLTFHEINKVPANTGVLLVKAGGATEAIPTFTGDADATTGNVFVQGTGAAVNYDAGGGYYNYVLFNGEDGIGFYQANNNTIAVNRAYVHVGGGLSVKSFSLNFDDETGISLTPAPSSEGEGRDAAWYDLTGRRVAQPTKGIYIHGGKKVMIK